MTSRRGAVVLATAVALTGACSGGGSAAVTTLPAPTTAVSTEEPIDTAAATPATTPSAPNTTAPASTAPASSAVAGSTIADLDAPLVFAAALESTSAGYRFVSTATVGDQVAIAVEGDHTSSGTRMRVASQGATVDYVVVDGRSWVFDADVWQELDDESDVSDPLGQLADPLTVLPDGGDDDLIRLIATYPATALGLSGDDVAVVVEIVDGRIVGLEYAAAGDGPPAVVRTELSSIAEPAPTITAPDA